MATKLRYFVIWSVYESILNCREGMKHASWKLIFKHSSQLISNFYVR